MKHAHLQLPSILVVEDEAAIAADVTGALSEAGFACQCCTTAEMALAKARLAPPDLIIFRRHSQWSGRPPLCQQIREEHGRTISR